MLHKLLARYIPAPAPKRVAVKSAIDPRTGEIIDLVALKARSCNRPRAELVRWDAAFSVNNGLIDEEHKAIVRLLNTLYGDWVGSSGALCSRAIMDELSATVVRHFINEEALLRENRCPKLETHKMAHRAFVVELQAIAAEMRRGAPVADVKLTLLSFVRRLVIGHVLTMDQDMARYMR